MAFNKLLTDWSTWKSWAINGAIIGIILDIFAFICIIITPMFSNLFLIIAYWTYALIPFLRVVYINQYLSDYTNLVMYISNIVFLVIIFALIGFVVEKIKKSKNNN